MAWTVAGNIKGPKGDQGEQGPKGDTGADGTSVTIKGTVATSGDLPTSGNEIGDGYITSDDGHLHVWGGTAFTDVGTVRGPQGLQGEAATISVGATTTGAAGTSASVDVSGTAQNRTLSFTIPQGVKGNDGEQGAKGDTGDTGPRGSKWFSGSGAPGTIAGSAVGDFYLDTASGDTYELA